MSAENQWPNKLWRETPLIRSSHISSLLDCNAYLKLESFQPAQSFKSRGISHFIQRTVESRGKDVHLVIASGGNAGLAAACAANSLHVRCTVFIPEGASKEILDFMKKEGAEVVMAGQFYPQALLKAEEAVLADANAVMVPAYDDPIVWEGHSSIVTELADQLPQNAGKPSAIVCSIGGGGLCGGVMQGCKTVGWDDVPVIGVETHGANCFYQAMALNRGPFPASQVVSPSPEVTVIQDPEYGVNLARLPKLTSRASDSLGAAVASAGVVKMALERKGSIKSVCVSDEQTMQAAVSFADDHKVLVELGCAATLTTAYSPELFNKLVPRRAGEKPTVIFVVCGGFKVWLASMEEYRRISEVEPQSGTWDVLCNGERWQIAK